MIFLLFYVNIKKRQSYKVKFYRVTMCACILLRPGILPLLPASMVFPPFMVIIKIILPPFSGNVNLDGGWFGT